MQRPQADRTELVVETDGDGLVIRPARSGGELVRRDGVLVHHAIGPRPADIDVVDLSAGDYRAAVTRVAEHGLSNGVVYDALHLVAAERRGCDRLPSFNERDFTRLWSSRFSIETP